MNYTNRIGVIDYNRKNIFRRLLDFINENKLISLTIIGLIVFTIFDILLVNSFLNLLILL